MRNDAIVDSIGEFAGADAGATDTERACCLIEALQLAAGPLSAVDSGKNTSPLFMIRATR